MISVKFAALPLGCSLFVNNYELTIRNARKMEGYLLEYSKVIHTYRGNGISR
jgi:hypothetical protein